MLALLVGALTFASPSAFARRDLLHVGLGVAAGTVAALPFPRPAAAEYYGEPPPKLSGGQYKEALQEAKDFKCAGAPHHTAW